jgi:hypothetical protein
LPDHFLNNILVILELLDALSLLQEAWIHPLLWALLQILSNKLGSLLKLQISQPLFLLAPDSKHI